jgi:type III pantothenate kinase
VLLAIDIGNSNVTVGSFRNGSLIAVRRAATPRGTTSDELEVLLEDLLRLDDAAFADVSAIACASVVPAVTDALEGVAARSARCSSPAPARFRSRSGPSGRATWARIGS